MARRRGRKKGTDLVAGLMFLAALGFLALVSKYPRQFFSVFLVLVGGLIFLFARIRRRRMIRARKLGELLALSPPRFEGAIAQMLVGLGYRGIHVVGGAGDLAVDIVCRDASGARVVVQCKRLSPGHGVGSPDVQKFIGMAFLHHGASRALFVTTSYFTQPAISLARAHPIDLIDGAHLSGILASSAPEASQTPSGRPP